MTSVDAPNRVIRHKRPAPEGTGLLAAIVQSSDDAIISADLDGMISSWNGGAERMFGFTRTEIVGKSIAALIPPDLRDEQLHILTRVKQGERVDHYETVRTTKSGERIDVSLTLSPLKDDLGTIVGIAAIVRDITSYKHSADALLHRLKFETFKFELANTFVGLTEDEVDAHMKSGLAHVGEFLEMDRVTLLEASRDRAEMVVAYSWSAPGVPMPPPVITKRDQPWWVDHLLRGEASLASQPDDLPADAAAEKDYLRQQGVQSAASIPGSVGGTIAGAIMFVTVNRRVVWTDDLVRELRAIGDVFWNALKRRQTMQAVDAARNAVERTPRLGTAYRSNEERESTGRPTPQLLDAAKRARRRAREAYRESDARYRKLSEQLTDIAFLVTDETGRVLDANRTACNLMGYTLEELKALNPEDVLPADVLSRLPDTPRGRSTRAEWQFRRKDGSVFTGQVVSGCLLDGRLRAVFRDISERKEAEEAERRLHQVAMLSLNKATLEDVLETILEAAIATAHADFGNIQLLDANASHLRIVAQRGFSARWIDYWKVTPRKHGACGTALNRGEQVVIEDIERSPIFSGADIDMQRQAGVRAVVSTPLASRAGKPIGMLSTHYKTPCRPDERTLQRLDLLAREAADVIGLIQARAELKRQAALLDLAQDSILVRDFDGHISYWNEGATQCYGWTKEQALGKVAHTLLQTQFPEPFERILDTLRSTGHWHGELDHTRRDGRHITVDSRWAIQDERDGEGVRVLEINNDITERKRAEAALRESEQRLQSYIDQAADAIYVLDGESGHILTANKRATEMLGYSQDELLRLSARDIECSHGPAAIRDFHEDTTRGVVEIEGAHRRKDGSTFPVDIRMTMLTPTVPHRILSIVRDVTERKRLEQERAEGVRRKDEFLAFMGHELRNPLAAIHTASHVLAANPSPRQRARMEEIITRQTTIMRRLVDDLLDLERITHGHIELERGAVELAECLRRAVAVVQSTVTNRHQELLLQLPSESVRFIADGTRLEQIVVNLLTNASKYSAPGSRIELSGATEDANVVICCKDNGQGIAPSINRRSSKRFPGDRKRTSATGRRASVSGWRS